MNVFGLFKSRKEKAKEKYMKALEHAQKAQRAGDIRKYSFLMEQAELYRREAEL